MNLALVIICVMLVFDRFRPAIDLWMTFGFVMALEVCAAVWAARQLASQSSQLPVFSKVEPWPDESVRRTEP